MASETTAGRETEKAPWDQAGYLGCIDIQRPGERAPAITAHVLRQGPHLLYRKSVVTTGGRSWFEAARLSSTDRKSSLAVMEDDTPERHESLRAALLADRWANVTVRG